MNRKKTNNKETRNFSRNAYEVYSTDYSTEWHIWKSRDILNVYSRNHTQATCQNSWLTCNTTAVVQVLQHLWDLHCAVSVYEPHANHSEHSVNRILHLTSFCHCLTQCINKGQAAQCEQGVQLWTWDNRQTGPLRPLNRCNTHLSALITL